MIVSQYSAGETDHKAGKNIQISETKVFVTIRVFYPRVNEVIDIKYYKATGKIKRIVHYKLKNNRLFRKQIIVFRTTGPSKVDIHTLLDLFVACKTHLVVNSKGEYVFEHLKFEQNLKNYGLKKELYLNNKTSISMSKN